jgi:hypothetical protein
MVWTGAVEALPALGAGGAMVAGVPTTTAGMEEARWSGDASVGEPTIRSHRFVKLLQPPRRPMQSRMVGVLRALRMDLLFRELGGVPSADPDA